MHYLNSQLLPLVPIAMGLAILLVWFNYQRKRVVTRAFGEWRLLSQTSKPLCWRRYLIRALWAGLAVGSLLVALARPVIPNGSQMIAQGTVDVVAVVDVSRSMAAMDYDGQVPSSAVAQPLNMVGDKASKESAGKPLPVEPAGTRLEMVRHVMLNYLLKTLDGNQLGVVSYAGEAFPQAFLTRDSQSLAWILDRGLTISSAPGEGSCMGKALELALALLDADSPAEHEKLIILFSDGGNDDSASKLAGFAQECRQRKVKLIVVAMGNVMPAKIPVSKLAADDDVALGLMHNGKRWYEVKGQIEKSGMNVALLQELANQAGGQFIHLQKQADLDLLNQVSKTSTTAVPGSLELFPWFLGFALGCLVLTVAITHQGTRRNKS